MSKAIPQVILNIYNDTGGYMTFKGFPSSNSPEPVGNGLPPIVAFAIPSDGVKVEAVNVSGNQDGKTIGTLYYNMPDGSEFSFYWYDNSHSINNPDAKDMQITISDNYIVYYQQEDGSWGSSIYWGNSDTNIFTATIKISSTN